MGRSVRERWREETWLQIGEAIGHTFVTVASLAILAGFRAWDFPWWEVPGGALATLPWVVLREGIDQWPWDPWLDTIIDSSQFIVGGAIGGVILHVVA